MECAQRKDASKAVFKSNKGYFVAYGNRYRGHYSTKKKAIDAVERDILTKCRAIKQIYTYY